MLVSPTAVAAARFVARFAHAMASRHCGPYTKKPVAHSNPVMINSECVGIFQNRKTGGVAAVA